MNVDKARCEIYRKLIVKLLDKSGVKFNDFMHDCIMMGWLNYGQVHLLVTDKPDKKPPLGVMPRERWNEKRKDDLFTAMCNYHVAGKEVPVEWMKEYIELSVQEIADETDRKEMELTTDE